MTNSKVVKLNAAALVMSFAKFSCPVDSGQGDSASIAVSGTDIDADTSLSGYKTGYPSYQPMWIRWAGWLQTTPTNKAKMKLEG